MQVASVSVGGLYDQFDLTIELHPDVTILHGANGLGKTTLITLLHNVLRGAWGAVSRSPFRTFEVRFRDGTTIAVDNAAPVPLGTSETPTHAGLSVTVRDPRGGVVGRWAPQHLPEASERAWRVVTDANPWLAQTGADVWLDRRTGLVLGTNALLARHPEVVPILRRLVDEPAWLAAVIDTAPSRLITADRLIVWDPENRHEDVAVVGWMPAVTWYAGLVGRAVRAAQEAYAGRARALDRSFPLRVLRDTGAVPSEAEERERFVALAGHLGRLHDAGLIDRPDDLTLPDGPWDETERRLLRTYLDDTEAKLAVFDRVLTDIEAMRTVASRSFLRKSVVVDGTHGLVVVTDHGQRMPLTTLSSGEQHAVVLACALLFELTEPSLVLIDEPELSLHIAWQQQLVDHFLTIAANRGHTFLVATHSPQIVHTHWDLAVDLEGEDEGWDPDEDPAVSHAPGAGTGAGAAG